MKRFLRRVRRRRHGSTEAETVSPVAPAADVEAESTDAEPTVAGSEVAEVDALTAEVLDDLSSIDAAHSDLVLHRAIELAHGPMVVAEQFPVANLQEVAAELHIPVPAVAEALAEYRAGGLEPSSVGRSRTLLDRLVGPDQVKVGHRTGLGEQVALARLSDWLKRRHRLRIRINAQGAVVGVRRRGVVPAAMRRVRSATGTAGLSGVREVRGAAVSIDGDHTAICVVADVRELRTQSVVAGSVLALGGAVVISTAAVVTAPVTLVGVPVVVGAGWMTSRLTHRHQLRRITEEVEMTADGVAAGAEPPTLTREISERLGGLRLGRAPSEDRP